jgi:hypothetical protein
MVFSSGDTLKLPDDGGRKQKHVCICAGVGFVNGKGVFFFSWLI